MDRTAALAGIAEAQARLREAEGKLAEASYRLQGWCSDRIRDPPNTAGCTDMGLARQAICTLAEELQHSAMLKYLVWGLAHVCRRDLGCGESDKFWIYLVGVAACDG